MRSATTARMVKERYNEHRLGECGSDVHNVQIFTHDCSGKVLSDDEIVDVYMRTYELSDKISVRPCFENHNNMWSEHPGRVEKVAEKIRRDLFPIHQSR
jgi:hypothetical protein